MRAHHASVSCGAAGEAQHRVHHRQDDQLGVAELRRDACGRPPGSELRRILQQVVGLDVQCGREGVQLSLHTPRLDFFAFPRMLLPAVRISGTPGRSRGPWTGLVLAVGGQPSLENCWCDLSRPATIRV